MRSYRSLIAWQHAHQIAVDVLRMASCSRRPETWAVFDQLRRAAVSIEANVVEGYALGTSALFKRHIRIAIGSAAEVECLLGLAVEVGVLGEPEVQPLRTKLDELLAVLRGLLRSSKPLGFRETQPTPQA